MKLKLFGFVVLLSFFNIAFADSAIVERKMKKNSAIMSSTVQISTPSSTRAYNSYQSAIREIENKIVQNPNSYGYYIALAELYNKMHEPKKTYEQLTILVDVAKQNKLTAGELHLIDEFHSVLDKKARTERNPFWSYVNLSMLNLISQNSSSTQQCLILASKKVLDNEVFMDALNRFFSFYDDDNLAIKTIDSILVSNPQFLELKKQKAKLLVKKNRIDDGIKEMQELISIIPDDIELKYYLFKALQSKGMQEKHILKKIYPNQKIDYDKAYYDLAQMFFNNGELIQAKELVQNLIKKSPENANAYILLSEIYKKEGNLKASYEVLNMVRDKADNNEQIAKYNVLLAQLSDQPVKEADSLMNNGLYAQALSVLQTADQENLYVVLGMARANYFLQNKQIAFDMLNKAMTLYPNNPDVFYYFAYIFYKEGDIESSRKYIQNALKIEPKHQFSLQLLDVLNKVDSDKYTNQIISSFDAQNYTESMRLINEALTINKKDSALYYYQGLTYIAMNNYAASTAPLYKSIELDKNNTLAYFYLALAFDNLSEQDNALAYYKKFIQLLPKEDYGESEKLNYAKSRIEKLSK